MKNTIILLLLPLFPLISNAQLRFISEYATGTSISQNTLTDVPLTPGNKKVDVYFNSDKPKVPYYKIRVTNISGPVTSDYNQLLLGLQNKAMAEGFDGLLMMDLKQISNPYYNFLLNQQAYNDFQNLYAIGIKYKANMEYVDTIVKSAEVEFTNPAKTYSVNFRLNGLYNDSLITEQHTYYSQNILLFNRADLFIKYLHQTYPGGLFEEPSPVKLPTDSGAIKYSASLDHSELNLVNIKLPSSDEPKVERNYSATYDMQKDGKIITRWLFKGRKKRPYYKDVYTYDDRNRCTGFTRYDSKTNEQTLNVKYTFFSMEDLPQAEN